MSSEPSLARSGLLAAALARRGLLAAALARSGLLAAALARRGLLAAALARAEAWLLEPPEATVPVAPPELRPRPVVAVFGLGERCGTTLVARALGAVLAARDTEGACAVTSAVRASALPLGSPAANRLARVLAPLGGGVQPAGRLCLVDGGDLARLADAVRYVAPLVVDGGRSEVGGAPAALADHVLLVAAPGTERALAGVVRDSLARVGPDPLVVLNRLRGRPPPGLADIHLPESRMGAQLALAGREPRGELGRAVAALADSCEGVRS
jgi:hypothetical protein